MRNETKRPRIRTVLGLLDRLAFSALCLAAVLIPLRNRPAVVPFAVLLLTAALLLLLALDRRAAAREKERIRKAAERAVRIEKLLLLPDEALKTALKDPTAILLRGQPPSLGEITDALRKRPRTLAVLSDPEPVRLLIETHSPETILIDADTLLSRVPVSCTQKETDRRLAPRKSRRKSARRILRLFGAGRWKYFLLGTLLLVLSLVWRHKIYYRLLSALCFGMSVISGTFGLQKANRNFGIFLDNRDK